MKKKTHISWKYQEKHITPWWYILCMVIIVSLLSYEIHLAFHNKMYTSTTMGILLVCGLWTLFSLSQGKIGINTTHTIYAGNAHIDSSYVTKAFIVTPSMKSAALGRQSDPLAYMYHKSWIKSMVLLILDDPRDPTPYWIISSRNPEKFLAALPSHVEIIQV